MEEEKIKLTFHALFDNTVQKHGNSLAYSFVGEEPISYAAAAKKIRALMAFLEKVGIKRGDRVAVISTNMPNWSIVYFYVTFMGAVAVPVLPDFSVSEVSNVLEHSEAKVTFVSSSLLSKIEGTRPETLETGILIEDFSIIFSIKEIPRFDHDALPSIKYEIEEEDLASIIYTSGTTGRSKGVMLTHKNISFNAIKGGKIQPINENDRFLSVLPLSHTYENTLGLILPMIYGAGVYYLRKPPTPPVLLPALETVKPTIMLSVPLIIEKVYFNKILPSFNEKLILKLLYKIPFIRMKLNARAKIMNIENT